MKQVVFLFFVVSIILFIPKITNSQTTNSQTTNSQTIDINKQIENELTGMMLETIRESRERISAPKRKGLRTKDFESIIQVMMQRDVKELNDESDALLVSAKGTDKESLKETAKHADKIAKLSNRIRKILNHGDYIPKAETAVLTTGDRSAQMLQLAGDIDDLIEKVSRRQEEALRTVDVSGRNDSFTQLKSIESMALGVRKLARSKN